MNVPYLKRDGSFRPQMRKLVAKLKTTDSVRIPLYPGGGYKGEVFVKIGSSKDKEFVASVNLSDWTRFPARIRAAATELRDQSFRGSFQISHSNGVLKIKKGVVGRRNEA